MKYVIYVLFCLLILSCKDKKPDCCVIIDTTIDIEFRDSIGRDLLNQSQSYAYKFSDMQHLYLDKNNSKKVVYVGNLDYPKEMLIYKDVDSIPATLKISPHIETYEHGLRNFTDYIQLSSTDEDTIQTQIEITNSTRVIKFVKYNGQNVGRYIIITK